MRQWHAVACFGLKGAGWPVHSMTVPLLPLLQAWWVVFIRLRKEVYASYQECHKCQRRSSGTQKYTFYINLLLYPRQGEKKKKGKETERGKVCPLGIIFNILQSTGNITEAWEDGFVRGTHEKWLWETLIRAGLESRDLRVTKASAREQHSWTQSTQSWQRGLLHRKAFPP